MNRDFKFDSRKWALLATFAFAIAAAAFPPLPHHTLFGQVRDEMGNPLVVSNAFVIFEPVTGAPIEAAVVPNLQPGIEYEIPTPLDAGLTPDLYKRNAQRPGASFRLRVRVGSTTYLPIEMTGNLVHLGLPAKSTRLDLTVGIDQDNDGIPDAWERAIQTALGLASPIHPGDLAPNGMTYYANYIAGTYPFDPNDGFNLAIVGYNNGAPQIDFTAIRGRAYTLFGSSDMVAWTPLEFKIPADGPSAQLRSTYQASELRHLRLEVAQSPEPPFRFFKMKVQ